ncbi:hypothetical protein [Pseudomonas sichuanensis]|uniref:hypothetical protein n=1 Tax=Pseudomonas sichuanensis TaxID=2213015 RepID=UPI002AB89774|nr:hypothetical protein [Pseudomonas sichuanensis]MDZ4017641.1 hypothetical protein [Pseudomonas sichuanensis]
MGRAFLKRLHFFVETSNARPCKAIRSNRFNNDLPGSRIESMEVSFDNKACWLMFPGIEAVLVNRAA